MVYQVEPQEILCPVPVLFMTVVTQRSSAGDKWWEVTAHQADRDRPKKESAESVPGRWDLKSDWPFDFFPFPLSICGSRFFSPFYYSSTHLLSKTFFLFLHLPPQTRPVYWAGNKFDYLHRWINLLRLSWKLGNILGLGEFRGKK